MDNKVPVSVPSWQPFQCSLNDPAMHGFEVLLEWSIVRRDAELRNVQVVGMSVHSPQAELTQTTLARLNKAKAPLGLMQCRSRSCRAWRARRKGGQGMLRAVGIA